MLKNLHKQLTEVSMGVGGTGVANPEVDPGTGIPIPAPLRKKNNRKKPIPAKRMNLGSPANSSMVGTNIMIPGRSAFAKGIESFLSDAGVIAEMFIEGKKNLKDGAAIIAYRSKIWVFPDEMAMQSGSKRIFNSIKKETNLAHNFNGDINSLEERPDVLTGVYNKTRGTLSIFPVNPNFSQQAGLSPLVNKVAKALGVKTIINQDDNGENQRRTHGSDIKPKQPTWGLHGTSSKYLFGILKRGLMPKPNQTNFKGVVHKSMIFLTVDSNKAVYHANTATPIASQSRGVDRNDRFGNVMFELNYKTDSAGNHYYQPVIIKVKIPHPALLTADYDIDRESDQQTYTDMFSPSADRDRHKIPGNATKISQHLGVFGYKGRILPQMITDVYIGRKTSPKDDEIGSIDDMRRFDPSVVMKAINKAMDHGLDMEELELVDFIQSPNEFLPEPDEDEDGK